MISRVSHGFDPDQDRRTFGPYLGLKLFAKVVSGRHHLADFLVNFFVQKHLNQRHTSDCQTFGSR